MMNSIHLPLHASWLNQIEILSIVQRKLLASPRFNRERGTPRRGYLAELCREPLGLHQQALVDQAAAEADGYRMGA